MGHEHTGRADASHCRLPKWEFWHLASQELCTMSDDQWGFMAPHLLLVSDQTCIRDGCTWNYAMPAGTTQSVQLQLTVGRSWRWLAVLCVSDHSDHQHSGDMSGPPPTAQSSYPSC